MKLTEAEEADARAMYDATLRGVHVNYLTAVSGYSIHRVQRLIAIGKGLEAHDDVVCDPHAQQARVRSVS